MTTLQLTRPSEVLAEWTLFEEGFKHLDEAKELSYEELEAKKLVCRLTATGGYVAVAYTDEGEPVAFLICYESTLPFLTPRSFMVFASYYRHGSPRAMEVLSAAFQHWCRKNSVRRYSMISRRPTHVAKRMFYQSRCGFNRLFYVFEKNLPL